MSDRVRGRQWLLAGIVAAAIAGWPLACNSKPSQSTSDAKVEHAKLDYVLKDMNGNDVRLADYKGRPLLINFWATYCEPCKHEIPAFIELSQKYKDKHFAVLGVSVDDSPADLQQFAKQFGMNYPVLIGNGHDEFLEHNEANFTIPISWFVKPDGTILLKKLGSDSKEWFDQQIRALFDETH